MHISSSDELHDASYVEKLRLRINNRTAAVGVIGLGYVGLPLIKAFANKGFKCFGFDIDQKKVAKLQAGITYIRHLDGAFFKDLVDRGQFCPTSDFSRLPEVDAIIVCVPTPLSRHFEPDLSYVVGTAETISAHLQPGQLVVLESTTYPGTTQDEMRPVLERSGLKTGAEYFLAFSPEREDPGNPNFETASIPKVVGADDAASRSVAEALYGHVVDQVVAVSTAATAEAVKLTENIFRSINIALVNELKIIYDAMGIDVWEVINAAKTKPFGYMPFFPGPGLGGHCIPIDPFYLSWKAREYQIRTRFIELAGEINTAMPLHVVRRLAEALDIRLKKGLNGSKILIIGVAYKKNIDDMRESPALRLIDLLHERNAEVLYHDPFVPEITPTREHPELTGMQSEPLTERLLGHVDAVLIATDHDGVDYKLIAAHSKLVIDTRNVMSTFLNDHNNIVKA